jgi:hypothetical protein
MRKKKIITSIVVVICVLVGIFFIMRFNVMRRINNAINKPVVENKAESEKEEGPEELKYETWQDEDGNEFVVEMRKITVFDEEGNEAEMWEDTAENTIIYSNEYFGRIEKIEDNKIYFMVDKENEFKEIVPGQWKLTVENVKDYEIIFDIDTYDLEGPNPYDLSYSVWDSLTLTSEDFWGNDERFFSAGELEFLVGEYLEVWNSMDEDYYTGEISKGLTFQLSSPIKSFILSLFF